MRNISLKDYMEERGLSEQQVLDTLMALEDSYVYKNDFVIELDGDTAYIETIGDKRMEIVDVNLKVGYIEVKAK